MPRAAAALRAAAEAKKGVSKVTPSTSAPASRRTQTASWESSPPDMSESPRAFLV